MKIKKPSWVDDNPHKAGKRLSNIYWGEYPVWKRDEEILKWATLDEELLIYSHTFIYYHRGVELSRETFKTQGSQNIVYHLPTGYILEDSTFTPKKHGVNKVNVVKEAYTLKFICKHPNLATPIELIIKKPENAKMTITSARNEIISHPSFPSGYDVDVPNFTEFPDDLTVDNDYTYNVPLKVSTSANPTPIKKVTIKYYLVDSNGDQTIYKTETHRYLSGSYDYIITIPVGYEQTRRVDNDENNTSIYMKVKVYNINIRLATYKNGNINTVWHTYKLERTYNQTVTQADLAPFPDNLKVGTAPNLFKVTLRYPDGFTFTTRTITEDLNIDLEVKASLKMVEIVNEVDVPRIDEVGIGVYTYGLPTGFIKPNSIKNIKIKFVANSIGLENGEKAFAAVFPYNPVKQTITGNGFELVTGKTIGPSVVKDPLFIQKLKTDFSGDLNGTPNDILNSGYFDIYVRDRKVKFFDTELTKPMINISDNFHKDDMNANGTLKERWNYKVFNREFEWTILETSDISEYTKSHKCWIIISNIVLHPRVIESYNKLDLFDKCIAANLPYMMNYAVSPEIYKNMMRSVHGTLPTIQVYEAAIDVICPLTIKDYRYYLCDNAKYFITDTVFKLKNPEEFMGGATPEGYNRNILANHISYNNNNTIPDSHLSSYYSHNKDKIYSSMGKDNPINYYKNMYSGHLIAHIAFNWYKHFDTYNDVLDPALTKVMKKEETGIIMFNYWDVINHAIGKSLLRNHIVDSKLAPFLTKYDKDLSIFVNLQLLPVCIDVTNDKFSKLDVRMKEKDFGVNVFVNKKPLISFSPVNTKRILNGVPRYTYKHKYDKDLNYEDVNGRVRHESFYGDNLLQLLGPRKKLYAYRPIIYYSMPNLKSKIGYSLDTFNRFKNNDTNINLRKIYKNMLFTPKTYYQDFDECDITGEYLTKIIDKDSFAYIERYNYTVPYMIARDKFNFEPSPWSEEKLEGIYNKYLPVFTNKMQEIIEYNNSITIFDNWKEEISYDNPQ